MSQRARRGGSRGRKPAANPPPPPPPLNLKDALVKDALRDHRQLKNFAELRVQFERRTKTNVANFEDHLDLILKQYGREQAANPNFACTGDHCMESIEYLRDDDLDDDHIQKKAARMIIYACAQSNKFWWKSVVTMANPNGDIRIPKLQPMVLLHGTSPFGDICADVYCEQRGVIQGSNFYNAVLACYYLYWIFNLEYTQVDRSTYQRFDQMRRLRFRAHP